MDFAPKAVNRTAVVNLGPDEITKQERTGHDAWRGGEGDSSLGKIIGL